MIKVVTGQLKVNLLMQSPKGPVEHKHVNNFLPIILNMCFVCSKRIVSLRQSFLPTTYVLIEK